MADKVKESNQYTHLKAKYIGLGNADTDRAEFLANITKDTYASLAHHKQVLMYNSLVVGEDPESMRQALIRKMDGSK